MRRLPLVGFHLNIKSQSKSCRSNLKVELLEIVFETSVNMHAPLEMISPYVGSFTRGY